MKLSLIAAIARNGVIGANNALPWRLPADLKRFKTLTLGHTLIMGRKTFESIGRVLPGRTIVVVSRGGFTAPEGVKVVATVEDALKAAASDSEAFVAGGAEIYRQTIDRADRLYLTHIDSDFEGDTRFPDFERGRFRVVQRERFEAEAGSPFAFEFVTYDKIT
jgi:dihydrofolate reductase